jgi:hypothetical protein
MAERNGLNSSVFDSLYQRHRVTNQREEEDLGSQDGLTQIAYVEPGYSQSGLPRVGIAIRTANLDADYSASLYEGQPDAYGKITVFEPHLSVRGQGKGVNTPSNMAGQRGRFIQDKFDEQMAQASADALERPVLYTRTADYQNTQLREQLTQQGYSPRRGYGQFFDRIFQPSKKQGQE